MRKRLLIIFSLIFSYEINFSQTSYNIVPNSGFQTGPGSPRCRDYSTDNPCWFDQDLDNWKRVLNNPSLICRNNPCDGSCSSPDWMHTGCPGSPDPQPTSSDRWVFVGGGEGIQVALSEKLKGGHTYTIRMKLAPTVPDVHLRIHFSQNDWSNSTNTKWSDATGFIFPGSNPTNPVLWKMCQNGFTVPVIPPGTDVFQYLVIIEESGKFDIDDVEIFETGTGGCAQNLLIENHRYEYPELPFEASQFITAGYNVGAPTTDGNVVVSSTSDVTYKAGQEVTMKDGFSVDRAGNFHAYIAPCGSDCPAPVANAGADITVNCNNSCYQIGSPSSYGMTYSWTSNPTSAISYLSGSTLPNPLVCLPPGGYGIITYTLTVTNNCGTTAADAVTITPPFYLDISTGVNNGVKVPFKQIDPNWKITQTPFNSNTLQSAFSANPANPQWPVSSYSNWITMTEDANGNPVNNSTTVPPGFYDFSYIFNVSAAQYPNLSFNVNINEINVDNNTILQVNNNTVLSGINYTTGSLLGPYTISGIPYFQSGQNIFKASTVNNNDWQGLIIKGNIIGYCNTGHKTTGNNHNELTANVESKPASDSTPVIIPNPSDGRFIIQMDNIKEGVGYKLEIYNLLGKQIIKSSAYGSHTEIDLTNQPKGIYLVKIQSAGPQGAGEIYTEKVVVQ